MNAVLAFLKKEAVLCIALLAALLSLFWAPPSADTLRSIDFRVLCLLFSLMSVVAGFQRCGVFGVLAQRLLAGKKEIRLIRLLLVLLPFFSSMFITNDVALITFVPFAILVLTMIGRPREILPLVVLQTLAANLGSMALPVGNPQNLFLYAKYSIPFFRFFAVMSPLTLLSLVILSAAALLPRSEAVEVRFASRDSIRSPRLLTGYLVLFAACLLTVFRLLPYWLLTGAVLAFLLLADRPILARVDYSLLATFVCFFVFAGNMERIQPVRQLLEGLTAQSAAGTSVLASQLLSNVPAAVLLSNFTDNWQGLLVGTNLGGLGTLIASLASLISFRFYVKTPEARLLRYLLVFTIANVAMLAVLWGAAAAFRLL